MSGTILVGYSTNDLFYKTTEITGDLTCNGVSTTDCNTEAWTGTSDSLNIQTACIKKQLCQNESIANALLDNNYASTALLTDIEAGYNKTLIMTINLAIGVVAIFYVVSLK